MNEEYNRIKEARVKEKDAFREINETTDVDKR